MGTLVELARNDDSGFNPTCVTARAMPGQRASIQHQPGSCHGKGTVAWVCFMHTLFYWKMHKHLHPPSHLHVLTAKTNTHQGNKTGSFMENQSRLTLQFQPLFQKGHSCHRGRCFSLFILLVLFLIIVLPIISSVTPTVRWR